jgi:hypothetical protein
MKGLQTVPWGESPKTGSRLESAPITKADVDALIAADPELEWSTTNYVDMKDDSGAVTRYHMIRWGGHPCFWWYRDQIQWSGPDDATIQARPNCSRTERLRRGRWMTSGMRSRRDFLAERSWR